MHDEIQKQEIILQATLAKPQEGESALRLIGDQLSGVEVAPGKLNEEIEKLLAQSHAK